LTMTGLTTVKPNRFGIGDVDGYGWEGGRTGGDGHETCIQTSGSSSGSVRWHQSARSSKCGLRYGVIRGVKRERDGITNIGLNVIGIVDFSCGTVLKGANRYGEISRSGESEERGKGGGEVSKMHLESIAAS